MSEGLQVFYCHQVDDPYSYLLSQVLPDLVQHYGLELDARVVPPPDEDLRPQPALQSQWARRDAAELARYYPVEFPPEAPDPAPQALDTVNRILAACPDDETFIALAEQAGHALWRGDAETLDRLAREHGALGKAATWERLAANARQRRERGHYQGGMLCLEGEWFWGLDRLDLFEHKLRELTGRTQDRIVFQPRESSQYPAPAPDTPRRLEFYFSFRSPYSYLALKRLPALMERHSVELEIKLVLPMVMRGLPVPRIKAAYIISDTLREARRHGIAFGNFCDPVGAGVERSMAVFEYARQQGRALAYLDSVATGIWAEAMDTSTDEGLSSLVRRAGLDWEAACTYLANESWRSHAEDNQQALFDKGLWGVPSFRLGDYCAWGQDRLWMIDERLRKLEVA